MEDRNTSAVPVICRGCGYPITDHNYWYSEDRGGPFCTACWKAVAPPVHVTVDGLIDRILKRLDDEIYKWDVHHGAIGTEPSRALVQAKRIVREEAGRE